MLYDEGNVNYNERRLVISGQKIGHNKNKTSRENTGEKKKDDDMIDWSSD